MENLKATTYIIEYEYTTFVDETSLRKYLNISFPRNIFSCTQFYLIFYYARIFTFDIKWSYIIFPFWANFHLILVSNQNVWFVIKNWKEFSKSKCKYIKKDWSQYSFSASIHNFFWYDSIFKFIRCQTLQFLFLPTVGSINDQGQGLFHGPLILVLEEFWIGGTNAWKIRGPIIIFSFHFYLARTIDMTAFWSLLPTMIHFIYACFHF